MAEGDSATKQIVVGTATAVLSGGILAVVGVFTGFGGGDAKPPIKEPETPVVKSPEGGDKTDGGPKTGGGGNAGAGEPGGDTPDRKTKKNEKPVRRPADDGKTFENSVGMRFARLPAGEFDMGTDENERGYFSKLVEKPRHKVILSRPFAIGVYEVTQGQFKAVMGRNPSQLKEIDAAADHPVTDVTWDDAVKFCKVLSARPEEKAAGREYRLPTEAEWEYACRAGTETHYAFGDVLSSHQANFNGFQIPEGADKGPNLGRTAKVGSYKPNPWGLYDMHGNVQEWCSDYWDPTFYRHSLRKDGNTPRRDPQGPEGPYSAGRQDRVVRGGAWDSGADRCTSAARRNNSYQDSTTGFRVVCVEGGALTPA